MQTPWLWDPPLSIWQTAWEPGAALRKYQEGEPLSDDELLGLVEFGTLRVVNESWFSEEALDGEAEVSGADGTAPDDGERLPGVDGAAGSDEDAESDGPSEHFGASDDGCPAGAGFDLWGDD